MNWDGVWDWFSTKGLDALIVIVVGAAIYMLIGYAIAWFIRRVMPARRNGSVQKSEVKKRQRTLIGLFTTIAKVLVVLIVVFTVLSNDFGINLAPLLASAGIAGIALGFGAQTLVKDSLSGFFILMENQYRVGDYIEIGGSGLTDARGAVEKVSIRSTVLRDREGNVHFIPNGSIVHVTNKTLGFSKVHFSFKVEADSDIDKVTKIINDEGKKMARDKDWKDQIIDPIHFSEVGKFDKDGIDITVSGITQPSDQWKVTSEYRKRLLAELAKTEVKLV